MYFLAAHYSHILLAGALALPLVAVRPGANGVVRSLAWMCWSAAVVLTLNDIGYNLSRDPTRPYANLEMTLAMMSAWPVIVAFVIDRYRAWRRSTPNETVQIGAITRLSASDATPEGSVLGMTGAVLATVAPQILMLAFLAAAALN